MPVSMRPSILAAASVSLPSSINNSVRSTWSSNVLGMSFSAAVRMATASAPAGTHFEASERLDENDIAGFHFPAFVHPLTRSLQIAPRLCPIGGRQENSRLPRCQRQRRFEVAFRFVRVVLLLQEFRAEQIHLVRLAVGQNHGIHHRAGLGRLVQAILVDLRQQHITFHPLGVQLDGAANEAAALG